MHNERNSQPLLNLTIWHMNIDRVQQNSQPIIQHTSACSLKLAQLCIVYFYFPSKFWMFANMDGF